MDTLEKWPSGVRRRFLDRDNSNRISYKDFSNACRLLRLQNVPGIWRALDQETSGFISLREIDRASAEALEHFKEWAESTFGTIVRAFRVLDTTRSNSLSFPIFKRALRDFGFTGDARVLFQSLKPDSSGRQAGRDARLTLDDLRYLSSWELSRDKLQKLDREDALAEMEGNSAKENRERLEAPRPARKRGGGGVAIGAAGSKSLSSKVAVGGQSQRGVQHGQGGSEREAVATSPRQRNMFASSSVMPPILTCSRSRPTVEELTFCRGREEYEAFTSSRAHAAGREAMKHRTAAGFMNGLSFEDRARLTATQFEERARREQQEAVVQRQHTVYGELSPYFSPSLTRTAKDWKALAAEGFLEGPPAQYRQGQQLVSSFSLPALRGVDDARQLDARHVSISAQLQLPPTFVRHHVLQ
eukprot:gnl/TRDRNA2_/TRDRNA2_163015_c0_seq1.p1 gnl/TRDRNA2_/TRDRNA2_163015_c0~~gnl/TRDRNA2_/TRDRNA2_163015_c0_seq1.p1  ORF type:complete len:415 (-),score=51.75 gnl/TRDRNA2_/TRDRNA2_163015_c0_seq1:29-1273(-)